MKFRTEITFKDTPFTLNPECPVLLVGSCFADNIGEKIRQASWPATVNPCGVLYNPVSIALVFQLALTPRMARREILMSSVTRREGKFVSWFMDSKVADESEEKTLEKAMEAIDRLENALETAHSLILTFGTPEVYMLKNSDRAVGNCHKHPAAEFQKSRLSINEISNVWKEIIRAVRLRNPNLKVILTVSPRRYLADGFAENSRKKSVLLLACENLCSDLENCTYFPAYEILIDDLRDYRFYSADLLHPSAQAVDYIWEKFCGLYLDDKGRNAVLEGQKKYKAGMHRPIL